MKKTLLALAALAATGVTLAQSGVTVYGRMDLGTSSTDVTQRGTTPFGVAPGPMGTTEALAPLAGSSDAFSLAGAQDSGTESRLGFRITEDLGDGLSVSFVYEIGINADRQTAHAVPPGGGTVPLNNAQTRLANLSFSGDFGTVQIGTFLNAFDTARAFSPSISNNVGGDFLEAHGDYRMMERIPGRSENVIMYSSPDFNGFAISVGAMKDDNSTRGGVVGYTREDTQGAGVALRYEQGPLTVRLVLMDVENSSRGSTDPQRPPNSDTELLNWLLAVRYNLAPVVLSFLYEDARRKTVVDPASSAMLFVREFNAWELGARFPMGAFAPYVTFGEGDITSRSGAAVVNTDTSAWQIGTTYNLSTRTWVYAAFGEIEFESPGFNRQIDGYRLGLVHTF